jgi:pyrimidine operon attenuation protein/uracil phosphoribosyltransferase
MPTVVSNGPLRYDQFIGSLRETAMPTLLASQRLRVYDSDELDGVLQAMARQAAALLPPAQAVLIGIQRRGEPLAQRLQQHLSRQTGQPELPLYPLKIKRYADDLSVLHAHTQLTENPLLGALDLASTTLLVVDDVLFEGHSLLRTCAYLAQLGARRVYTAVLVDRHVCQQTVHADIVGVHLQVAPTDIVECNVPPTKHSFASKFCAMVPPADGSALKEPIHAHRTPASVCPARQ